MFLLFVVFESGLFKTFNVNAATAPVNYKKTSILDDLTDIDTLKYPHDDNGSLQIIRFQEYCYSESPVLSDYYGLYVYIYNPSETPLDKSNGANKLNIATAYDVNGQPTTYRNLNLIYCDNFSNRLYKFYIAEYSLMLSIERDYAKNNDGKRRYDVAGIQIKYVSGNKIDSQTQDHSYGYTFFFDGYAAFCDKNNPEADSTLKFSMQPLETIKLDVKHTNYRTGVYKDNVCDELNTVYFTVSNDIFSKYGNLQEIDAEWYEYKTKPIFVTSDSVASKALTPYIGKYVGKNKADLNWSIAWERWKFADYDYESYFYDKGFNIQGLDSDYLEDWEFIKLNVFNSNVAFVEQIDWLFYKEGAKKNSDYKVSKTEMLEYAKDYLKKYATNSNKVVGANGEYSANLFENSIDKARLSLVQKYNQNATSGYVRQSINIGDIGSLTEQKDQSWWDKLWKGVQYKEKSYDPIIVLDNLSDLQSMSVKDFAANYLVNVDEAETIKNYCENEIKNNGRVVLFRFAVTDYYASTAYFERVGNDDFTDADGYVAQETVFLNFDVISLTFRGELNTDVVIPCVSDPLDIINGVEPRPNLGNNSLSDVWSLIIGLFLLGFLLFAIIYLCPWVISLVGKGLAFVFKWIVKFLKWKIKFLWRIITFPFKLIGKLFHRNE